MVALNTDFAASKPDTDTKNRVGRFFSLAAENVGADRRSSRKDTGKKRDYRYDTTSVDTAFEYGPFGELIRATGEKKDAFNFRFSTKYEDTEIGLLYYGYRYYNAETGRWLSRDPIGEQGGMNLYGMVGNDTVNKWDYLGLTGDPDSLNCCSEWKPRYELLGKALDQCFNDRLYEIDPALHGRLKTGQFIDEIAVTSGLSTLGGVGAIGGKGVPGAASRGGSILGLGYLLYDSFGAINSTLSAYDWCIEEKCTKWAVPLAKERSIFNPRRWLGGKYCYECPKGSEHVKTDDRSDTWRNPPAEK